MIKYIKETFLKFKDTYENEVFNNEQIDILCKNWIDIHFVNNRVVNCLLVNLDDDQLDTIYDYLNDDENIKKIKNIHKLKNYLFLIIDSEKDNID